MNANPKKRALILNKKTDGIKPLKNPFYIMKPWFCFIKFEENDYYLPTYVQLQPQTQICLIRSTEAQLQSQISINRQTEDVKDDAFISWVMLSAVMSLMMYNLGVKCMWELVVECAMSWSQCSLLSTGHSAREFLWAEWDSITLPTHLSWKN